MMVHRFFVSLFSVLLVASCSNGRFATKIPSNSMSIPHVKSCVHSWDANPDEVDMVSNAIAEFEEPIREFVAFKRAADNGSSSYFISILAKTKDEGVFVTMDDIHTEPMVVSTRMSLVDDWIDRFQALFVGYKDQLVLGQTYKVSHPPCVFAISKRNGVVSRLIGVGVFDREAPIEQFTHGFHRLEDKLAPGVVRLRKPDWRPFADENRVEAVRERIENDIFFELAHWL